jgi:hypothetical protein
MRTFIPGLLFALSALCAGATLAQAPQKGEGRPPMKQEDRQRMREDMQEVNRGQRPERQRQMTSQEREKLRQDIRDANREMKR